MTHESCYVVRLGDRGRVVLPAELRHEAGFEAGDELIVTLRDGVVRLTARRELARAGRGMFARAAGGRDLIAELIAERREEAGRESESSPT